MSKVRKPSEKLDDFLNGKTPVAECDPAILSWAQFIIYQKAKQICEITTRQGRADTLNQCHGAIRPYLEREVKMRWKPK